MVRGILAVVAGYGVFAVSAVLLFNWIGQDPHEPAPAIFVALSALYALAFAILGGYVATRLSRDGGPRWALIVCALMAAGATISLVARPGSGTIWSQLIGLAASPAVLLGWLLASRRYGRATTALAR